MDDIKPNPINVLAREGGFARARTLTPEQRSEIARTAAQARWDRRDQIAIAEGRSVTRSLTSALMAEPDRYARQTELDALDEIRKKVEDHSQSPSCPCDGCMQIVLANAQRRYSSILAKIDNGEKLEESEALFFRLLTGSKANRWTRVYREECRRQNNL